MSACQKTINILKQLCKTKSTITENVIIIHYHTRNIIIPDIGSNGSRAITNPTMVGVQIIITIQYPALLCYSISYNCAVLLRHTTLT